MNKPQFAGECPVDGCFGCFHFLSVVNKARRGILEVFFCENMFSFLLDKYIAE